jgi:hypothetical protein
MPGAITLTRIFLALSSAAAARDSPTTPALTAD